MDSVPQKTCTKCGHSKPLPQFGKRADAKDGHAHWCKACQSAYDRRPERMAKHRIHNQTRYANNPEFREGRKRYIKDRYATNEQYREATRDRSRKWAEDHHDRVLTKHRHYWHKVVDKEQYNASKRQRRKERYRTDPVFRQKRIAEGRFAGKIRKARLRGSRGTFTRREWEDLCASYGNRCLCCGSEGPLTADHIVPVSKGGKNTIDNIQPLCMPCNSRKQTKSTDYRPVAQSGFDWED